MRDDKPPRPKAPAVWSDYAGIRAALDKIRHDEERSTPWHERRDTPQQDIFI
jgi:hypothetical protein